MDGVRDKKIKNDDERKSKIDFEPVIDRIFYEMRKLNSPACIT